MTYFAVSIYLLAIVIANVTIAEFGAWLMPINAFLLIGLDLALRDSLHDAWAEHLTLKMGALIAGGAGITYLVQPEAGWVALASTVAFAGAMSTDAGVYHWLKAEDYQIRANASNISGALVDSLLFPTIAFGAIMPWATLGQFAAKAGGGAVWAWLIEKARARWLAYAAAGLLFAVPAQGQDLYLNAHYDAARGQPIMSAVHDTPIPGTPLFATGFVEVWRNPKTGYPANDWVMFSKHWIKYPLTKRLSASVGVEMLYNRAGVNFDRLDIQFRPNDPKLHVAPKLGISLKVW